MQSSSSAWAKFGPKETINIDLRSRNAENKNCLQLMVCRICHFADLRASSSTETIDVAKFLIGETSILVGMRFLVRIWIGGRQDFKICTQKYIPDHEPAPFSPSFHGTREWEGRKEETITEEWRSTKNCKAYLANWANHGMVIKESEPRKTWKKYGKMRAEVSIMNHWFLTVSQSAAYGNSLLRDVKTQSESDKIVQQ